jgi:23S rRNA-/tRNA-specific pseudouridylate synthase
VIVPAHLDGARLDRVLRDLAGVRRSEVGALFGAGRVRVRGKVVRLASWTVRAGDTVEVDGLEDGPDGLAGPAGDGPDGLEDGPAGRAPWGFDERWVLRDPARHADGIAAVDKPSGLRSEPVRPGDTANLLTLATGRFGPGLHLVHRLDRDTSGVVLLATPAADRRAIDAAFQGRRVVKRYLAVVGGRAAQLDDEGELRDRLDRDPRRRDRMVVVPRGGDGALTRYRVRRRGPDTTLVELWPVTGRTHQLRVQLAGRQAPILGDRLYGDVRSAPRLMLHAVAITLELPDPTGRLHVEAPVPAGFA